MLYVSGYDKSRELFSITDTDDGAVEWHKHDELLSIAGLLLESGIPLHGVYGDNVTPLDGAFMSKCSLLPCRVTGGHLAVVLTEFFDTVSVSVFDAIGVKCCFEYGHVYDKHHAFHILYLNDVDDRYLGGKSCFVSIISIRKCRRCGELVVADVDIEFARRDAENVHKASIYKTSTIKKTSCSIYLSAPDIEDICQIDNKAHARWQSGRGFVPVYDSFLNAHADFAYYGVGAWRLSSLRDSIWPLLSVIKSFYGSIRESVLMNLQMLKRCDDLFKHLDDFKDIEGVIGLQQLAAKFPTCVYITRSSWDGSLTMLGAVETLSLLRYMNPAQWGVVDGSKLYKVLYGVLYIEITDAHASNAHT